MRVQEKITFDVEGAVVTDLSVDWDYVKSQYALGRPLKRVYEEILPNFTYSYFTRMMRKLSPPEVKTAPRIHHEPGENTQVDYCDGLLIYDPKTNKATKTPFFLRSPTGKLLHFW